MRRRQSLLLLSTALATLVAPDSALAHKPGRSAYAVTLVDAGGRALPTFWHGGQRWVLGHYGAQYGIRISNYSSRRVEAVLTVDGRDAITGGTGNYVKNRGYVISPGASITVRGFRQSLSAVAAFRFTDPGDSYSARMGTPQNVGVVGVAFFGERYLPPPPPRPIRQPEHRGKRDRSSAPEKSSSAKPRSAPRKQRSDQSDSRAGRGRSYDYESPEGSNLGTEYGHSEYSAAHYVDFRRAHVSRPDQIQSLRYDDEQGLQARGIELYPRPRPRPRYHPPAPEPFPDNRFAPPPPR